MGRFKVISLFTGAGGLDYGFEAAGYETAVAVELDSVCVATVRANRDWPVLHQDIARVRSKSLLATGSIAPGEAEVLIGGPPCQPFSKSAFWASGEAGRLNDPRARTLTGFMRVLRDCLPKAFLLENVEGLGFKGKDEGLRFVKRELERINRACGTCYRAAVATLNAADYGVPQARRRLFVVGARDGSEFQFPSPTHADPDCAFRGTRKPHLTAWDALWDVIEEGPDLHLKGKWADLLPSIPEGQNYLWHTDRGGGEPLFGWRRRYWNFLLKLAKGRPSWTLQAQPGPATGPFHWDNRRLSVRELARLQTFPDGVEVVGTLSDAQKQLGNAVPSLLAEVLAREIATQLLGSPPYERSLLLATQRAMRPPPSASVERLPSMYSHLRGYHSAHPGSGQGYRARGSIERLASMAAE